MLTAPEPLPGPHRCATPQGRVQRIVEVTDATPEELRDPGGQHGRLPARRRAALEGARPGRRPNNAQGEIYLTDIVEHRGARGSRRRGAALEDADEALGVNTRAELARAAAVLRRRTAERLMAEGVTIVDPAATWIDSGRRDRPRHRDRAGRA